MPTKAKPATARGPRTTIAVQGARVHNLKNVSLELPRDRLIVITGLSGSGKSSLAFDTIYAEGQRRYMESLSSYAKRFVTQVAKPDVDFIFGLSPVISIEQKTTGSNPRSTVGTMTDIASYLNLLFATIAEGHCPRTGERVPSRSQSQILEAILSLPEGAEIELRAPVFPVYGEELDFVFTEVRKKGCRRLIIDGKAVDLSAEIAVDETKVKNMDAVVDRFIVGPKHEKAIKAGIAATLLVGDSLMQAQVIKGATKAEAERFYQSLCSATHHFVYGGVEPEYFMFNNPESACRTCGGLGVHKITHPELLVPDPKRSILSGCFVKEAFKYNPDTWDGRVMYTLSKTVGFSLETPWEKLPERARNAILYGAGVEKLMLVVPPETKVKRDDWQGKEVRFGGIAHRIERYYRRYRQRGESNAGIEQWLEKVMVERTCPDCKGARLRATRLLFTIADKTIYDVGNLHFDKLHAFLGSVKPAGRGADAGRQVLGEIRSRLQLLLGIGLDYLNLNRRSSTLSGGESQRIRLSTQIGSGLMGMLYVLDEPSIGLHPKDNVKMIATLESLRDIGNTVIVVEHDQDTVRAADHIVEMGPGPGVHGGKVVVQGTIDEVIAMQSLAHRTIPLRQALDRHAQATPQGHRRISHGARRAREQSEERGCRNPARHAGGHHRRVGFGQEHADQRDSLQGVVEAAGRYAHAARRSRFHRRRGSRTQGGEHRPIGDRPQQPLESGDLHRVLRRYPRSLHALACFGGARLQIRPVQLQRQGRPLRGMPGRRRDLHPALLHAGCRGDLRRM